MKKYLYLIFPLVAVIACSLLVFTSLDNKIADLFQRTLKPLDETQNVVMVNVDNTAVEEIGTWPFSREVYSDAMVTLKDLGAEAVVYDLSFIDKSQPRVDKEYVTDVLPQYVENNFQELNDSALYILGGYADKSFNSNDAEDLAGYYLQTSESVKNRIQTNISYSIRDTDGILANNIKFFNNTYLTLTFDDQYVLTEEESEYLTNFVALDNITVAKNAKVPSYKGVQPAILDFMKKAKKAGFVNADADADGYLRRLFLVTELDGKYYGQLVFVPILEHFGNPKIEVYKHYILLKNCRFEDYTIKNIKIPLAQDGSVLVKYPKFKDYYSYNNLSFWSIYRISKLEANFVSNLEILNENGFFSLWEKETPMEMYQNANYVREALYEGESEDFNDEVYAYYKNEFYNLSLEYLNGNSEALLLESVEGDEELSAFISDCFAQTRQQFEHLQASRKKVAEKVRYAMCIFGTCATSTTDFGLIQYMEKFPNPGVHYAVANQLLTEDFVSDAPFWISILIAVFVCFGFALIAHHIKSTGRQMIFGGVLVFITTAVLLIFFMITKIYVGSAIPVIALSITFIAQTILNLITTSKDKKFITGAFSQCLSPSVVQELVDNPESFKLGGGTYNMSAIFTDIQKFSGFSELLTAEQLVALLNYYLTRMSDIIMEERGTVDKYEGDAIVALVGAPLQMEDHASRACAAAIKMKLAEEEMNDEIKKVVASGVKPADMPDALFETFNILIKNNRSIFTRIGINSGEIVAGYMGSDKKKNYTMMGNNVNLASRLEGVNKQYRTGGILISEATRTQLSDDFLVRSLDRVQVVNVTTPIRLYEVLGFKSEVDEAYITYVNDWEDGIDHFEKGDFEKALTIFKKLSAIRTNDNVAKYYIELIEKFFANGKYPTESDDFGVAYNAENPDNMNPDWIGTKFEIKGTFKLLQK